MFTQIFNNYLENLKDIFNRIIRDKKSLIVLVILIIIFSSVFYFVYNNYIKNTIINKHSLNREFVSKDKDKDKNNVLILFFHTEWCPYCKQALPEIKKLEEYIVTQNAKNDYKTILSKIDCDKNSTLADKYKVEGYPSIKLVYKNDVYNYDAKPDKASLIKFIETSID